MTQNVRWSSTVATTLPKIQQEYLTSNPNSQLIGKSVTKSKHIVSVVYPTNAKYKIPDLSNKFT